MSSRGANITSRTPILYLAPWVDLGGSDKGTIDWFRWIDKARFAPSLITTQPSANRMLDEVEPHAEEIWVLPELMAGLDFPGAIFDFIVSREIALIHVMNARLAFDLLPDLCALPRPPAVVVQLHVEEQDRSGYVRYVTTRYGNLVDAFSVTSRHLAEAMRDYHVPRDKLHVIYTGVDADWEYLPDRIVPVDLDRGTGLQVLYPGRLVEQKDPLLMVEVASGLVERHPDATVHVVGEGHMEPQARDAVAAAELQKHVHFHGSSKDLRPWYAACDVLLMTSVFEGIPYTVFEAMAMGLPIVAPALPGNIELLEPDGAALVNPRDRVEDYVEALSGFAADTAARKRAGAANRKRVKAEFSLEGMARAHERLYDDLLDRRAERLGPQQPEVSPYDKPPIVCGQRPSRGQPRVSVIVPCFNHGAFLPETLASLEAQTYPELEVIVIDDASTDAETQALLEALEEHDGITVIRQPENRGPSAARNAGIERATGRYVLPVDADNILLPDAVEHLVAQLQTAGERVGFIYPNIQYFGNRDDYFVPPDYDLSLLLRANYCDTGSLFDRQLFEEGIRFAEDIKLGHEDWDLMLSLAGRQVRGQRARQKTFLLRKHGFTRSDTVEYAQAAFHEEIKRRHRTLFSDPHLKSRWAPGLTLIALAAVDPSSREGIVLADRLARQSYQDMEVLVAFDGSWPAVGNPSFWIRRLPPGLAESPQTMLEHALPAARAERVLIIEWGLSELLEDEGFVEKLMRIHKPHRQLHAVALVDAADHNDVALGVVGDPQGVRSAPHSLFLDRRHGSSWPKHVQLEPEQAVGCVASALTAGDAPVQWRHHRVPERPPPAGEPAWCRLRPDLRRSAGRRLIETMAGKAEPQLPGIGWTAVRRWTLSESWMPPETLPLVRHRAHDGSRRIVTNDRKPPDGFVIEYDLGVVQRFSPPGTIRLQTTPDDGFEAVPRGTPYPHPDELGRTVLGHLELAAFPLLQPLLAARHRESGQQILVSGDADSLMQEVEIQGTLGWIEGYPIQPRALPPAEHPDFGVVGVTRALEPALRRHVYRVGEVAPGDLVGELGALLRTREPDCVGAWIDEQGWFQTEEYAPRATAPDRQAVARWVLAPLRWRRFRSLWVRGRSAARRLLTAPKVLRAQTPSVGSPCPPAGYLRTAGGPGLLPLYSGVHPITGDQLLTRNRYEATDAGYADVTLVGWMRERAPCTGTLDLERRSIPWASRWGLGTRPGP